MTAEPADSGALARQIQELIPKLGSSKFQERENASAGLLAIGEPALLPLAAAEHGKDAEISSRAQAIRFRIERERFETTALAFKRDPDPNASYGLPGWKGFSKVAGDKRPAKRLFLEMLEHRHMIALCLEAIDGGQLPEDVFQGLPKDPEQRLRAVAAKSGTEILQNIFRGMEAQPGDLIAMLVCIDTLNDVPKELHEATRQLCYRNGNALTKLMLLPGAAPSARKMMEAWFKKVPLDMADDVFNWTKLYRIAGGREMARRVLESSADLSSKADALYCLTMFGTEEDLPLTDQYVDRPERLGEFIPMQDLQGEAQAPPKREDPFKQRTMTHRQTLGDLALAAGCKIARLDLEKLFEKIQIEDGIIIRESIGFPIANSAERERALKTYKDHRRKP